MNKNDFVPNIFCVCSGFGGERNNTVIILSFAIFLSLSEIKRRGPFDTKLLFSSPPPFFFHTHCKSKLPLPEKSKNCTEMAIICFWGVEMLQKQTFGVVKIFQFFASFLRHSRPRIKCRDLWLVFVPLPKWPTQLLCWDNVCVFFVVFVLW